MPESSQPDPASHPLTVICSAASDCGRKRANNEDAFLADPEDGLFAVADGMGGHNGGEVASALAVETLKKSVASAPADEFISQPTLSARRKLLEWLRKTIDPINQAIQERAEADANLRGMGCTLDVVMIRGRGLFLSHVGDSRIYLLRDGQLHRLTEDHNFGQMVLSAGAMTKEEVARHPQRNVLTRALGPFSTVQVDSAYVELLPRDVILLCSDGLYNEVPEPEIAKLLAGDVRHAAKELVEAAVAAGGRDNVTAVVLSVDVQPERTAVLGSELARAALAASPLFSSLTESELLRVQKIAFARECAAGDYLFEEGQLCSAFFLTVAGGVTAWRSGIKVGQFEPGDPLGNLALLPQIASVSARCETPVMVLEFPVSELQSLLTTDPLVAAKLAFAALAKTSERLVTVSSILTHHRAEGRIPLAE